MTTDSTADFDARLAAAHAMSAGPAREHAITELALAVIIAELSRRAPSVRYVEFDWAPYGGLDAHAFLDAHGKKISVPGLAGDLAQWSTDLRSPHISAMIAISPHGPFLLDLDAPPRLLAPDGQGSSTTGEGSKPSSAAPHQAWEARCPIRVGDQLAYATAPAVRAEVANLRFRYGVLHACEVRRPDGGRDVVYPWDLQPADGTQEQWHEAMRTLHALQRAPLTDRIRQHSNILADHADALSRTLAATSTTLRKRQLPGLGRDRTEFAVRDLDDSLEQLSHLHAELAHPESRPD
ncbi:hypothetical protein [Nocardia mikamii]|uniref:hypothetical protein n=1 Tax=Nocardia mikamii TaxID=508464 RepID=UPI0007A4FFEF|nr:hypothetical protein [Nocardia mikamii]